MNHFFQHQFEDLALSVKEARKAASDPDENTTNVERGDLSTDAIPADSNRPTSLDVIPTITSSEVPQVQVVDIDVKEVTTESKEDPVSKPLKKQNSDETQFSMDEAFPSLPAPTSNGGSGGFFANSPSKKPLRELENGQQRRTAHSLTEDLKKDLKLSEETMQEL